MVRRSTRSSGRIAAAVVIIVTFLFSLFFSLSSFTGYVVSEEISNSFNVLAIVFFLVGVAGAVFLLRRT